MTRELSPIHDVVQAAALESLKETIGVDTAYEVLSVTGYDTLDHAYYSAAIDRIAELEDQRDALLAACECAEQTIRNLAGGGWIKEGDGVTIAMNESSNLQAAIHAAKGVEP